VIFLSITLAFFIFRVIPGDPVLTLAADPRLTKETQEAITKLLGLDKPLHEQYFIFLGNLLQGELGLSFYFRVPVSQLLLQKLENTFVLIGLGTLLSMALGLVIGVVSGWFHGRWPDKILMNLCMFVYSIPSFWIGMLLIYTFAVNLRLLPAGGMVNLNILMKGDPLQILQSRLNHLILPLFAYAVNFAGQYAIVMRNSMLDVLGQDYVVTAKAKGLSYKRILRRYVLRNAALPTSTQIILGLAGVVGGAVSVETIFSWPGIGKLMYDAIFLRDYPLLQGAYIITTTVVIFAVFVADIVYTFLDPRVKY